MCFSIQPKNRRRQETVSVEGWPSMEPVASIFVFLKSGQSLELLVEAPLSFPASCSLVDLKDRVSRYLGGTPSPAEIVLARAQGGALIELDESSVSLLRDKQDVFVFPAKAWHAHSVVQGASSSVDERRKAVVDHLSFESAQTRSALSLRENRDVQAARQRLAKRAALFGLQENAAIDDKGNCQFDAAADQLKQHPQFGQETKESVRARAVQWIRDNAGHDLGHGTSVRGWVEALPEYHSSFDEYLEKMSRDEWWGDEITLLAIREAYSVCIIFISSIEGEGGWYRTHYPTGKSEMDELPQLWLGYEHERHYWSTSLSAIKPLGCNQLLEQVLAENVRSWCTFLSPNNSHLEDVILQYARREQQLVPVRFARETAIETVLERFLEEGFNWTEELNLSGQRVAEWICDKETGLEVVQTVGAPNERVYILPFDWTGDVAQLGGVAPFAIRTSGGAYYCALRDGLTLLEVTQVERHSIAHRKGQDLKTRNESGWIGLSFPGGGIRSATFCSGALSALASYDHLQHMDYLCSVSGGGYMAASFISHAFQQPELCVNDAAETAVQKLLTRSNYLLGGVPRCSGLRAWMFLAWGIWLLLFAFGTNLVFLVAVGFQFASLINAVVGIELAAAISQGSPQPIMWIYYAGFILLAAQVLTFAAATVLRDCLQKTRRTGWLIFFEKLHGSMQWSSMQLPLL
jgi:hypothetical protein